jgi:protein SCO1
MGSNASLPVRRGNARPAAARRGGTVPFASAPLTQKLRQSRRGRCYGFGLIGLLGVATWCTALAAQSDPQALLEGVRMDQRLNEQVPGDLVFRDETNRSVRLDDYFGRKPIVLALVYYRCPKLCHMVLEGVVNGLGGVQGLDAGNQFDVLVVSFDPDDKPDAAARKRATYVQMYGREGTSAGWHFLTGAQPAIDALTRAVGFYYKRDPATGHFAHDSGIVVLTPDGRISRYFKGIDYLPRDLRLGLIEASKGKIGSPVDSVLLLCFHYDATTGKYTANVMNFLRAGGTLTLLAVGGLVFFLWRRGRRRARQQAQGAVITAD